MKRTVDRSKNLPAFQLDLPGLRLLIEELLSVVGAGRPRLKIELSLKGEELKFSSIEELESYAPKLPAQILGFDVSCWDFEQDRHCSLRSGLFTGSTVHARAPDEAWCAGAIAIVEKHAFTNRQWYRFFRRWHFWLVAVVLGILPGLGLVFHRNIINDKASIVTLTVIVVLSWVLYFSFNRLFPAKKLIVRLHENWFRQYATELTLALALVSLVVSLLAVFK
jgi:hypothetical protein